MVYVAGLAFGCGDDVPGPDGGDIDAAAGDAAAGDAEVGDAAAGDAMTADAMAPDAAAAAQVPRLEQVPCRFELASDQVEGQTVTCGDVVVHADREQPGDAVMRLHVARFHGADPDAAPLLMLSGGPGNQASSFLPMYDRELTGALAARGDLIVFDQRGVGQSEPALACPELTALSSSLANPATAATAYTAALGACQERLTDVGIDLSVYDSAHIAADVADLARVMGYERVDLLGVSYGGRLALEVMRTHPEIVRAVVLDAPVPPDPPWIIETGRNTDEALSRLFGACTMDAGCRAAYGNLEQDLSAAVAQLDTHPFTDPVTGQPLSGNDLVIIVHVFMRERAAIVQLPALLHAAGQGDYETLGDILAPHQRYWRELIEATSWGMFHTVLCADVSRFITTEQLEGALVGVRPELVPVFDEYWNAIYVAPCATWPLGPEDTSLIDPVVSSIPTLVLAGEYDPITPRAYAEGIASHLSQGHLVVAPNTGHGVTHQTGDCGWQVVTSFFQDPDQAPDATCLSALDLDFELP